MSVCDFVASAKVLATDGTYLGKILNKYDVESIFNEIGNYGSQFSQTSVWNHHGLYGDEFSSTSAFNLFANMPPSLVKNDITIGCLTLKEFLINSISPFEIKSCEF